MKVEDSECFNLEHTEKRSLILFYLNLVNLQKLALPILNFLVEFFLNALFPKPRKLDFVESIWYRVGWDIYKGKPGISW